MGGSGKAALRYLLSDRPLDTSLGEFVQQRHSTSDGRIAIMNVCNVPMQAAAFGEAERPDLAGSDWALIEGIRRSRAKSVASMRSADAREVAAKIVEGLCDRVDGLSPSPGCRIVAAGMFARRMVAAVPHPLVQDPLLVPHPSFNLWNRPTNRALPGMIELKRRFTEIAAGRPTGG